MTLPPHDSNDEALLLSLQQGDRAALKTLSDRWYRRVLQFMLARTGNWDLALDLSQDVFVTLFRRAQQYDPSYTADKWIFMLARDRCADHFRASARHGNALKRLALQQQLEGFSGRAPLSDLLNEELLQSIHDAVAAMPEARKAALLMRLQGMSYAEIGKRLRQPESTVRYHISLTIQDLKNSQNL